MITVPNTGHLIIEENPAQLAIEIKAFFEV